MPIVTIEVAPSTRGYRYSYDIVLQIYAIAFARHSNLILSNHTIIESVVLTGVFIDV